MNRAIFQAALCYSVGPVDEYFAAESSGRAMACAYVLPSMLSWCGILGS